MYYFQKGNVTVNVLFSVAGLATQILIIDNKNTNSENTKPIGLLIDVGDGACRDILANGVDFSWINHIAITHGHYDHIGGLYSFLGIKRMLGHTEPVHLYFPHDCKEILNFLDLFEKNYQSNTTYSIIRHSLEDLKNNKIIINSTFELEWLPVTHRGSIISNGNLTTGDLIPAVGYKIRCIEENYSISYSGDTGPDSNLNQLFSSDLGFIEATHPNEDWVTDKINRFHLTEEEAIEFSKNCKRSILIHKLPRHVVDR